MILLVVIVGGYCWRQKNQTIISKTEKVSCETLKDILSVSFSPENVRQRFLECFPERTTSAIPLSPNASSVPPATEIPTEQGPTCDELGVISLVQYTPPDVRDKFFRVFP